MDKLIQTRRLLQTDVERTICEVNNEFQKDELDPVELRQKLGNLKALRMSLQCKDEEILDLLLDKNMDEKYVDEFELIEEYQDTIRRTVLYIEIVLDIKV